MTEQYQIQEYTQTAAAIALLKEKYSGQLYAVTTTKGMEEAKKARAEVKGYRVALEKLRVEIKAPALERTRLIDAEAKRITAELLAIEEPIDQQIKEEERRKEEEKAAKARAEVNRLATLAAKISDIRNQVSLVANQTSTVIQAELDKVLALELSEEEFQEFLPEAIEALEETQKDLKAALNARLLYEAEQARIKAEQEAEQIRINAEREELARLREIESIRQAEQARIEAEARKVEAMRLQAEREAQEAELKAQREELEQKEKEIRQQQALEAARLQAEREEQQRQRAELEAQQRAIDAALVAKVTSRTKEGNDPLEDIKKALNANAEMAKALDEAYQRGYQAGLNSAQQAA